MMPKIVIRVVLRKGSSLTFINLNPEIIEAIQIRLSNAEPFIYKKIGNPRPVLPAQFSTIVSELEKIFCHEKP